MRKAAERLKKYVSLTSLSRKIFPQLQAFPALCLNPAAVIQLFTVGTFCPGSPRPRQPPGGEVGPLSGAWGGGTCHMPDVHLGRLPSH